MAKYILGHRAQSRAVAIRYTLLVGVLLILVSCFQVSFLARFRLFDAFPDLMLVTVLCLSYFGGRYMGAIAGIAGGFLLDAIGSSGISLLALFYFLIGYFIGHYARAVIPRRFSPYIAYLGVAVLFRAVMTLLLICLTYKSVQLPQILLYILLPEAVLTALLGAVWYFPMRAFFALLAKIR